MNLVTFTTIEDCDMPSVDVVEWIEKNHGIRELHRLLALSPYSGTISGTVSEEGKQAIREALFGKTPKSKHPHFDLDFIHDREWHRIFWNAKGLSGKARAIEEMEREWYQEYYGKQGCVWDEYISGHDWLGGDYVWNDGDNVMARVTSQGSEGIWLHIENMDLPVDVRRILILGKSLNHDWFECHRSLARIGWILNQ